MPEALFYAVVVTVICPKCRLPLNIDGKRYVGPQTLHRERIDYCGNCSEEVTVPRLNHMIRQNGI